MDPGVAAGNPPRRALQELGDALVWERASLRPDFAAGDTVSGEQTCPCHLQVRGTAPGEGPVLVPTRCSAAWGPSSSAFRGSVTPSPLSGDCIVPLVRPLRLPPSTHPSVLGRREILVIPEVPSLSPLARGPSVFGFLILSFLILFLGLNYDYTASLRRVDLK